MTDGMRIFLECIVTGHIELCHLASIIWRCSLAMPSTERYTNYLSSQTFRYTFRYMELAYAYLPPANEVCEGYVFTSVCLSTVGECLPHCMLGYTPHQDQRQTPPPSRHPPESRHPPRIRHTPPQCMLGDMGNKQVVHILLECILVWMILTLSYYWHSTKLSFWRWVGWGL